MSEKIEGGYTPGGWIGEVYEDGGFVIQGPDGAVLCQRSSWPSRASESRANGHLMLAAPELLAACQRALVLLEPFNDPDLSLGLGSEALDPLRAAIAKATGSSS